jgi:hypothetical protein
VKVRTLSLLVAVLQKETVNAVSDNELDDEADSIPVTQLVLNHLESTTRSNRTANPELDLHLRITQSLDGIWLYLIVSLVAGIILLIILKKSCGKYCQQIRDSAVDTDIALQIGSGGRGLIISVITKHALKNDLVIHSTSGPKDLEVHGILKPELSFEWKGSILNNFTGEKQKLPQRANLSYSESYCVKRIIQQRHAITPIFWNKRTGEATKIPNTHIMRSRNSIRGDSESTATSYNGEVNEFEIV